MTDVLRDKSLFLGDIQNANDRNWIGRNEITHIITVCDDKDPPRKSFPNITYYRIPFPDNPSLEYWTQFKDQLVETIHHLLLSRSRVLVHCMAGVNRSASVVIYYIVRKRKMNLADALKYVSNERYRQNGVEINPAYIKMFEMRQQAYPISPRRLAIPFLRPLSPKPQAQQQKVISPRVSAATYRAAPLSPFGGTRKTSPIVQPYSSSFSPKSATYQNRFGGSRQIKPLWGGLY